MHKTFTLRIQITSYGRSNLVELDNLLNDGWKVILMGNTVKSEHEAITIFVLQLETK